MTVSLSLFAGVGAQFSDDNGVPLSGGLIYTYNAGTTTPAVTYQTSSGSGGPSNSNPIVLDSAGRVPYQIWLTDGTSYKFVLKTSVDATVRTENNVYGAAVSGNTNIIAVATFADLSSTTATIGQQVSVSGIQGGLFDVVAAGALANDGGWTVVNGSIAFKRNATYPSPEHFGTDPVINSNAAFGLFLTYIKANPVPAVFTADVRLVGDVTFDFASTVVDIDFAGFKIINDGTLTLQNLAELSAIKNPSMYNATTPYVITRWDSGGNWVNAATALASLTQTNAVGYYQPTVNDTDIYSSLPAPVQSQNIFSRLKITTSNKISVHKPKGRHCLYEFLSCNDVTVENPSIMIGGKGTYGTILFNNATSTDYGLRNKVIGGGYIGYGSYSSITFMRNKYGGVTGGFTPFRSGESGVKTYQNEVGSYSARCYEMEFGDINPFQTVFDGIDTTSDFGSPVERVNDYTLAQYAWNMLPTRHTVYNIKSTGCNQLGIWGDGQFNTYSNIKAINGNISGIHLRCYNSDIIEPKSQNNNKNNVSTGTHQILLEGTGNRVIEPFVETDSSITQGFMIYSVAGNEVVGEKIISANSLGSLVPDRGTLYSDGLELGSTDSSQNSLDVVFFPRKGILTNPIGRVRGTLEIGTSGSEQGQVKVVGVAAGAYVGQGVTAHSQGGGFAGIGVAGSADAAWLANSEVMLWQNGANLTLLWKKADGSTASVNLI